MAALTKGKGTAGLVEISSVYTAIPQCTSIEKSGEKSTVFNAQTLDGAVHPLQPSTGYCENPTVKVECFWDSGNAVHAFIKTSMRTPPTAGVNFKLTDVAASPVSEIWNVMGFGVDEKYVPNDGAKATITMETSGNPS